METQEAVNIAQWQLQRIKFFMDQAQAAWHSLNSLANGAEVQDALDDYHNQEGSIGHCLRWGCQAAEDLVDLCNTPEDINGFPDFPVDDVKSCCNAASIAPSFP